MSSPRKQNIAIIGAGILGVALAREILIREPGSTVTVYEKEDAVATHQTGHNSGVIHAGLYYTPGSLKATLCHRGARLLEEFATEHNVAFESCGKLVIASTEAQLPQLQNIYERSIENQVPGARLLSAEEIQEIEPHAIGLGAVHSPKTGIIDYRLLSEAIAEDVRNRGGSFRFNTKVTSLTPSAGKVTVETASGKEVYDRVIACAGLQSDRIAKKSGSQGTPKIVPFSGDYFVLDEKKHDLVKGLIYPVPDPNFPFLGVHLTRTMSGQTTVGPNAFLSFHREGYGKFPINIRDSFATASYPAFWKFAAKNSKMILAELFGSSKGAFAEGASAFVPGITTADLHQGPRGIRAQAMDRQGRLLDDFAIDTQENILHIRNAPSPAATASLAIAEYLVEKYL
ncbi:MAG: L-2-hydroxyglutarate oxidase [Microbacteriaceae bacterium]